MDITKKNRTDLKTYFVKNAIPTEGNFADLIDAMLNQSEDGIAKLAGNPLSIEATGDGTSLRKAINFYESFSDANPAWAISLNPRTQVDDPTSAKPGFAISDPTGANRLFIDKTSGNVGVGTIAPQAMLSVVAPNSTEIGGAAPSGTLRTSSGQLATDVGSEAVLASHGLLVDVNNVSLGVRAIRVNTTQGWPSIALGLGMDVDNTPRAGASLFLHASGNIGVGSSSPANLLDISGAVRSGTHPTNRILYVTADFQPADGIEFRHSNATQGIGFGYNTIYAAGSNFSQDLNLQPRGFGGVNITRGTLNAPGGLMFEGAVSHINRDGALYRCTDSQVYLTVDDLFYVRQSGTGVLGLTVNMSSGFTTVQGRGNEQVYIGGDGFGSDAQFGSLNAGVLNFAAFNPTVGQYMNIFAKSYLIGSDIALKTNIAPISGALGKISTLRGVSFDWKDGVDQERQAEGTQGNQIGLIAQEVREVFPELVSENRGFLSVSYTGLVPVLVEAIKELHSRIDRLEDPNHSAARA